MSSNIKIQERSNIVSLSFDAAFFFERGTRSLSRQDTKKALKYFRKCVELDMTNPEYFIHLAATYTELGEYEESNRWLTQLVTEIDQESIECYYYMANNCAHLGDFDQAEMYTLMYLQAEPEGIFKEDAQELLDLICFELERSPQELDVEYKLISKHEKSKCCLEEGKFIEATRLLEEMVEEYPHFLAARNNLALSYYYLGQFGEALAVLQEILSLDQANLHALCNLAIFYSHKGKEQEVQQLISGLKKIYPLQVDQHSKLAITLGILGEDKRAYQLLKILYKRGHFHGDLSLYHYLAVAAYNTQNWHQAQHYWNKLKQLDRERDIATYYLEVIEDPSFRQENQRLPYHYQLPYDVQLQRMDWFANGSNPQDLLKDPLIRSSLFWSLKNGNEATKMQVLQSFAYFADQEVEEALRHLLLDPLEEESIKKVAIYVLYQVGAAPPYQAIFDHEEIVIDEKWLATSIFLDNLCSERYDQVKRE